MLKTLYFSTSGQIILLFTKILPQHFDLSHQFLVAVRQILIFLQKSNFGYLEDMRRKKSDSTLRAQKVENVHKLSKYNRHYHKLNFSAMSFWLIL